jgi:hypothetical protein
VKKWIEVATAREIPIRGGDLSIGSPPRVVKGKALINILLGNLEHGLEYDLST